MDTVIEDKVTKLQIKDMSLSFGGLNALTKVSIEVKYGEILAIIGPNGAGKTSLFNCVSGFYHPKEGNIIFEEKDITNLPSHKRAEVGISRTFQNIQLYTGLTALENLMAARHIYLRPNFLAGALYFGWEHDKEIRHRYVVEEIIDFLDMAPIRKSIVGSLPYGQRKRVDLGRALALEPRLLLLDEPMAGMNVEEKEDMARFIIDIYEGQGVTYPHTAVLRDGIKSIVLVEHDMGVVMDICDRIVVLDFGKVIAEGTPEQIKNNQEVIKAYLGKEEE